MSDENNVEEEKVDEIKLKRARKLYRLLCEELVEREISFDRHDDEFVATFTISGGGLPMRFIVQIDADRELVRVLSPMSLRFNEQNRVNGAISTSQINYRLADGCFDYDFKNGKICFRLCSSYRDSIITRSVFQYIVTVAVDTVEEYKDKFFMLSKDAISIDEFLKKD